MWLAWARIAVPAAFEPGAGPAGGRPLCTTPKRFIGARMGPGAPWPWCRLVISADELRLSGWPISWFRPGRLQENAEAFELGSALGVDILRLYGSQGPLISMRVVRGGYLYVVIRRIGEIWLRISQLASPSVPQP
jgi:hypothetical protein